MAKEFANILYMMSRPIVSSYFKGQIHLIAMGFWLIAKKKILQSEWIKKKLENLAMGLLYWIVGTHYNAT